MLSYCWVDSAMNNKENRKKMVPPPFPDWQGTLSAEPQQTADKKSMSFESPSPSITKQSTEG